MSARLATVDGVIDVDMDPEEITRPCDVAAIARQEENLRSLQEDLLVDKIATALERREAHVSAAYVRSRLWA